MKITVLDGYTLNPGDLTWDALREVGELTVFDRTEFTDEKIISNIGASEIIFTNKTPLTRAILSKVPSVKYIGVLATGYNVVDIAAASEHGIIVTNIPAYSTMSVAQLTFALLLELCHHTGSHSDAVFRGEWTRSIDFCLWKYPLTELDGKTMGIIGFGNIGRAVAGIAIAFGLKLLIYSHFQDLSYENENCRYASLDKLLSESDIVSLHCPLNESTRGIINKYTIEKMKTGVFLINTARGPLVNEKDLYEALESGKIAGAGVDVVSEEPIKAGNPLLKARNCIITPHIAWAPLEARTRLMKTAVQNLRSYLSGNPVNVVGK